MVSSEEVLHRLKEECGVKASAVVSRDGLVIAADVPGETFVETFAIMCATILGAAVTANAELGCGLPKYVLLADGKGWTIIMGAGRTAVLICVADNEQDLNNILEGMERAAEELKGGV